MKSATLPEPRITRRPGHRTLAIVAMVIVALASPTALAQETRDADVERLARELDALKARVLTLEAELARAREERSLGEVTVSADKRDLEALASVDADGETDPIEDRRDPIEIGGALRFTGFWSESDESVKGTRGDSGLDLFRIGAEGAIDDLLLSAEYRFYPFMDVLHHGWIGYRFDDEAHVEVGLTQVPFGLLPYAAHNFWFGVPYYLGFSDDYDLGAKYVRNSGPWDLHLAFFKNGEPGSPTDLSRYSFDVVSVRDSANEETNQLNARLAYTFGRETGCSHELGVSGQWGELYNTDTDRRGDQWAAAAHLDSRCGRWNVQLQAGRYGHDPENPAGMTRDRIVLGGFETSYEVAARGTLALANIAYNVPIDWAPVDQLICYNDYSVLFKDPEGQRKSQLNTTGCA
ncbi:MAG: hypothetical protein R3200_17945, partial [Xanthomonadales bacterium]|nr:hypothetical protein [Xanthomonadales bacterium]